MESTSASMHCLYQWQLHPQAVAGVEEMEAALEVMEEMVVV